MKELKNYQVKTKTDIVTDDMHGSIKADNEELKKINKNVTGLHIEKVEDLDAVVKMLGEKQ